MAQALAVTLHAQIAHEQGRLVPYLAIVLKLSACSLPLRSVCSLLGDARPGPLVKTVVADVLEMCRCGDSCAPGIGVPAAAASGMIAANTLSSVRSQLALLDALAL